MIPKSTLVMLGQEYEADIFLVAYDSVNYPIYVNGKQIQVENGVGKYRVKPSKEGVVEFSGELHVIDAMDRKRIYPFEHSFEVYKPATNKSTGANKNATISLLFYQFHRMRFTAIFYAQNI